MICPEFRIRLDALLDGTLEGDEARRVRSHLLACPGCASALSRVDRLEVLPVLDEDIEPSQDLDLRFRARLMAYREKTLAREDPFVEPPALASLWFSPGRIAAVGALAAFLFFGVYFGLYQVPAPGPSAAVSEIPIAENLPLLENMGVIKNLDLLEDFDTIEEISQDEPAPITVK